MLFVAWLKINGCCGEAHATSKLGVTVVEMSCSFEWRHVERVGAKYLTTVTVRTACKVLHQAIESLTLLSSVTPNCSINWDKGIYIIIWDKEHPKGTQSINWDKEHVKDPSMSIIYDSWLLAWALKLFNNNLFEVRDLKNLLLVFEICRFVVTRGDALRIASNITINYYYWYFW